MAAFSKLSDRLTPQNSAIIAFAAVAAWTAVRYGKRKSGRSGDDKVAYTIGEKEQKKDKAAVDAVFFKRMARILKILIPGFFTMETWYVIMIAVALAARTYCDVWMIQNGTQIESAIIGRNKDLFKLHLTKFLFAMPAISVVNNVLKYGLSELKLRFRTRLSLYLYDKYLQGFTYYKMSNLDNRIANADQLLTQDVEKLCTSVADLYSNLSKPLLDIIIYATKLTSSIGAQGPSFMFLYLIVAGVFLTRVRRPIGKLTVVEQKLEGEFRYVNSRLITNCEEIAFYQGNRKERTIIMASFQRLVDHLRNFIFFRMQMGFVDNIVAKYFATVVGFSVISVPFLSKRQDRFSGLSHGQIMEDYYKSGRMLVKMAESMGRVALAGRELTRLAGFATRVSEFMKVLEDISKGSYERTMVREKSKKDDAGDEAAVHPHVTAKPGNGKLIIKDRIIKFDRVPLITPNGDLLVNELSFEVHSGQNVLVCGPNGCGKSSLFRILGELWPLFGGTLTKPPSKELFYIPQRPYMTLGTLRDQVIYPDSVEDQKRKGITDADLKDMLDKVQLGYILDREGGWNCTQDWMDVLSGGEKQRMAMSRLIYHKPQYAILDECTSAVSVDVEGFIYNYCRELGITLFTVSHRKSLWKHHEFYLHMDGRGSFEFKPITSDTVEFGS